MQRLNDIRSRFFWKLYLAYSLPILCLIGLISAQHTIATFSLICAAIALFIGLFLVKRVTVPISEIMVVCEAMRKGIYDRKVRTLPNDEVGLLGDTLNRLGDEITNKIRTISLERAQLKTILAGMVEGIIAIDHEDKIEFCNRAAYRLLNSAITDCRGMNLAETSGFDKLKEVVEEARNSMELVQKEISFGTGDSKRIMETYATPFNRANISGVIIVVHDITRIRKLERVRRDFVANVSHEIKTPLTAIKGYTETLLGGALDDHENSRRFVEKVDKNASRLANLVQDFLSLARIESEENLDVRPTNWNPIIKQVIQQHEDQLKDKGLELSVEEPDRPLIVLGEKEAMHQVFDNLVTNAIRYTQAGGKIQINLKRAAKTGIVEVEDTGIGIPTQDLDRIFERFYRVDKARSREVGGTGLGLSIVRNLVDSMNGKILVDSHVGKGSRFSVHLNLSKVN